MAFLNQLKKKFFTGHERSVKAKKNIIALFAVQGYSIAINLALIPITLHLLNEYKYGVWITLFNVISWISIFDIGIGNGLRNKFAEAMAKGQIKEAREYVSTGYVVMTGIALSMILIFIPAWFWIDWARIFNVKAELSQEIAWLVGIAFILTSVHFCLKLVGTLLTASHKPAITSFIMSLSNTLILVVFLSTKKWIADSLIGIGLVYTLIPVLVFIIASFIVFKSELREVKPSLNHFKRDKVKSLFELGIKYFLIQISVIVILQTDSLIITHILSPEQVTPYNISYRYFALLSMLFGIILTPLWSSYTEAFAKNDIKWIKSIVNNQIKLLPLFVVMIIIMIVIYKPVIRLWIGKDLENINYSLMIMFGIQAFLGIWNNLFGMVLNGISKVRLSTILVVISAIVNIPLSIYFAHIMGLNGIILGTIFSGLLVFLINPIQVYFFIYSKNNNTLLNKILQ